MRSLETASRSATWRASVRRGRLRVRLTRSMRRSPAYRRLSLRLRRTRFDSPDTHASALVRGRGRVSLPRRGPHYRDMGGAGGRTAFLRALRGRGRVSLPRRGPHYRDMGGAGDGTAVSDQPALGGRRGSAVSSASWAEFWTQSSRVKPFHIVA